MNGVTRHTIPATIIEDDEIAEDITVEKKATYTPSELAELTGIDVHYIYNIKSHALRGKIFKEGSNGAKVTTFMSKNDITWDMVVGKSGPRTPKNISATPAKELAPVPAKESDAPASSGGEILQVVKEVVDTLPQEEKAVGLPVSVIPVQINEQNPNEEKDDLSRYSSQRLMQELKSRHPVATVSISM